MQKVNQLHNGLWHIEKFLSDEHWDDVKNEILKIPDNEFQNRHEPMRLRLEIVDIKKPFYQTLVNIVKQSVPIVSRITSYSNLRDPPGLFLWRDTVGFKSDWHPDDFTKLPTAQIYIDGEQDQGTSFKINNKEYTIPFESNSGYLMDNRYQIVHGLISPVKKKIRQSMYLIY